MSEGVAQSVQLSVGEIPDPAFDRHSVGFGLGLTNDPVLQKARADLQASAPAPGLNLIATLQRRMARCSKAEDPAGRRAARKGDKPFGQTRRRLLAVKIGVVLEDPRVAVSALGSHEQKIEI